MPDKELSQSVRSIIFSKFADRLKSVEVVHIHESGAEVRETYHMRPKSEVRAENFMIFVDKRVDEKVSNALKTFATAQEG